MSSMSSLSSSTRASLAPSFESSTSADTFFVFCVYDFEAADADQLSFRSNEILEVVRQEESGWWAALRQGEDRVGWIPSAYVEPISDDAVEELYTHREQQRHSGRTPEEDNEGPRGPLLTSNHAYSSPNIVSPGRDYEWAPMIEDSGKPLPPTPSDPGLPKDVTSPVFSPIFSPLSSHDTDSSGQDIAISPFNVLRSRAYPPSPNTPMPQPPPKSAPLTVSDSRPFGVRRSLSCPQPPVPSNKMSSPSDPGTTSQTRNVRRRPVLIEDSLSLKRLSVLLEAHGANEVEEYIHSPDMEVMSSNGSVRSHGSRSDKVKQITGDDEAQAIHEYSISQASHPWYLLPIHGDDDMKLESCGAIASGTLPAIVERLTLPLNPVLDQKMRRAFLRTFRTFCSADEIFDLLLKRYNLAAPGPVTPAELEEWRAKRLLLSQKRVLGIFLAWLVDHNMIEEDPPIARRLQDFLSKIKEPPENVAMAQEVMKTLERLTFAVPLTPVPSSKPHKRRKTKDTKNELLRTDPTVLAEQLCLYEHRFYAKIHPQECLHWVKTRSMDLVGNLLAFCTLHDKLAGWVKQSVLWTDHLGRRADTVDFWIKVAEKCRAMHNYSSMSAITTALSSTVISKLHLTWAHVGRTSHLDPLTKFNDPSGGFASFRQAQQTLGGDVSCVPFVGMYLTDIVHINDQYKDKDVPAADPDKPPERHFCFVKRRKWAEVLDTMLQFQKKPYPFAQDPGVVQFIEVNFVLAAEKDQATFWSKSQEVLQAEVASADIRKGLINAGF